MEVVKKKSRKVYRTYDDMMAGFAESVTDVLEEIQVNMKALKVSGRDNDQAKVVRTKKILNHWFSNNGFVS